VNALHLGLGRDAAQSIGDIAERLNLSRRRVERDLESLVLSGVPVVACERGVYIAQTAQEVRAYADSLRGRIGAVQARISSLERAAAAMEAYQGELWPAA
jgi:predicted DNA-binding transcriptional regulator YafY